MVVGTHNECDYGRPAIQYVHYPTYLRPRPDADLRWYHGSGLLLDAYYRAADALADFDPRRLHENVLLANSDWTAGVLARAHGIRARTVYPPVAGAGPAPPWRDRTRGFLAVGRLSPEKEHERVMRIVAEVRRAHPEVTLTIVGAGGGRYGQAIRAQAAALGPWVRIVDSVSRNQLRTLMASHRYGIHGMREEHFGMAIAEMVRAGVIVWVPDGGGQVEIIGDEPLLRYGDEQEAAALISHVLSAPQEEGRLREWVAGRAAFFSASRFIREIREVVDAFLA